MARQRLVGTLTGTGFPTTAPFALAVALGAHGNPPGIAAALWGTFSGTVALQRSRDGGVTWNTISRDATGVAATFTGPCDLNISDPVQGDLYAWNCTAFTSGTINWDLAQ